MCWRISFERNNSRRGLGHWQSICLTVTITMFVALCNKTPAAENDHQHRNKPRLDLLLRTPGWFHWPLAIVIDRDDGEPVSVQYCYHPLKEANVAVLEDYPTIEELYLGGKEVQGTWLVHVGKLPALQLLQLEGTSTDDAALAHIAQLQQLKHLGLDRCTHVTEEGMKSVAKLTNLEVLYLYGVKIGDKGLSHLTGLKKLQAINLERTSITDKGLEYLKAFPSLKWIYVSPFPGESVTQRGIDRLRSQLPDVTFGSALNIDEIRENTKPLGKKPS